MFLNMLCKRLPTRAKRNLATMCTSDPVDLSLPATACVRTWVLPESGSAEQVLVGDTPACSPEEEASKW